MEVKELSNRIDDIINNALVSIYSDLYTNIEYYREIVLYTEIEEIYLEGNDAMKKCLKRNIESLNNINISIASLLEDIIQSKNNNDVRNSIERLCVCGRDIVEVVYLLDEYFVAFDDEIHGNALKMFQLADNLDNLIESIIPLKTIWGNMFLNQDDLFKAKCYLSHPRIKKYFNLAIDRGYIKETPQGYKWFLPLTALTYFLDKIFWQKEFEKIPFIRFEKLFNVKNLKQANQRRLKTEKAYWIELIDSLFVAG